MKIVSTILSVMILCTLVPADDPVPYLKSAPMPFYPPIARQARIEGTVKVHATVNQDGDTTEIEALSGHALLRSATVEYVKGWKFIWPHPCACKAKRDITFLYKMSGKEASANSPTATVRWFGSSLVEVEADELPFETQN